MSRLLVIASTLSACVAVVPSLDEPVIRISGRDVAITRPTPVAVPLKPPSALAIGNYLLVDTKGQRRVPLTVYQAPEGKSLALVLDRLGAHEVIEYHIEANPSPKDAHTFQVRETQDGLVDVIASEGGLFTRLHTGPAKPYFHPLIGPRGRAFTRAFPMEDVSGEDRDHNHQRSFWFTYGDVNGFDYWASDPLNGTNPRFGTIRQRPHPTLLAGPSVAVVVTQDDWLDPQGEVLLVDDRVHRFWEPDKNVRVVDVDIRLMAGKQPVAFGDTKEGAFGLRVPTTMNVNKKHGGRIENAEGITDLEAWGKRSPWVDYSGPIGDETMGIAILNHPASFRHPTAWHVRDYGLFAANPFGRHDFKLDAQGPHTVAPGESLTLRYRVILHRERAKDARIADLYAVYANPPKVEILPQ